MPQIYDLSEYTKKLSSMSLIVGNGLCSNIYVIGRENAVIVDTGIGNSINSVWPELEKLKISPENVKSVVLTHAHHDHAMGAFIILEKTNPKIFVHSLDANYIASNFGPNLVKVEEDHLIETDLWPLKTLWTPGHTEGGICLYNEDERVLFSGDTVFPDGYYGRYDGESGSLEAIIESLRKLSEIDVDIMLPGHGMPVFEGAGKHILTAYQNASLRI
ncbi:MBL fold metallo-hydrolase [Candidatus Bathyarchaeota archaeon]|nr:MBL fold metallo-hydrolase [Candidatus Bathyarchaeota archaeon]|tara:strand:- start:8251 stop:8901 length:651 start_codon:yes stop_codon:yes gene_type:complete